MLLTKSTVLKSTTLFSPDSESLIINRECSLFASISKIADVASEDEGSEPKSTFMTEGGDRVGNRIGGLWPRSLCHSSSYSRASSGVVG
jgi:hypothetical protein